MVAVCLLGQALHEHDLGSERVGKRLMKVQAGMVKQVMKKRWGVSDQYLNTHWNHSERKDDDFLIAFGSVCIHFKKSREKFEPKVAVVAEEYSSDYEGDSAVDSEDDSGGASESE